MADELLDEIDDLENEDTGTSKYLLFHLGDEIYGIDIAHIVEIVEMQKITEVPDMASYFKGVFNLRGKVIPAMDLRIRFNLPEREYDDRTCIIVVQIDTSIVGFIVDTVSEVHDIKDENIEPPPAFKSDDKKGKYISGSAKINEDVRILVDVRRILSDEELEKIALAENNSSDEEGNKE